MRTAAECRRCAELCRSLLSRNLSDEHRLVVQVMVEIWESLAREREKAGSGDTPWARLLKASYEEIAHEPIPRRFRHLLNKLDDAETRHR